MTFRRVVQRWFTDTSLRVSAVLDGDLAEKLANTITVAWDCLRHHARYENTIEHKSPEGYSDRR